jgi:mono/diheme cytochrome c family protein
VGVLLFHACKEGQRFVQGERIYNSYCQNCHMEDGQGLGKLIPPISNSDYYLNEYKNLVCIIKYGMTKQIIVNNISYSEEMPGVKHLTTAELSNLINYMNAKWYPDKPLVTPSDISTNFDDCKKK